MEERTKVGPSNGSLVVMGGGYLREPEILKRFIALAGGPSAPIVIIPTASKADYYGPYAPYIDDFMAAGALQLKVLHTRSRETANSEEFVEAIRQAQGIWFSGGRHWRLADVYLNTKTVDELFALLDRGGVIGGTSAGATIQGSYLVRADTKNNYIMMGDHEEGFGFLRNVAIDQHHLRRNRHFDLIELIEAHPELLGIGIDEETAIIVRGDEFEVIGRSYVAIYDNKRLLESKGRFYFLAAGDRYDLNKREVITPPAEDPRGFERLVEQEWALYE
ncbi:MAG: cyanophycinase [Ardenticatenaceae bacterium]